MRKTLLSILLLCGFTVTGFTQTISGEYSNTRTSATAYYTKIKWEVSYVFEEKDGRFYIRFYNPKIKVPNYSLYHDEFNKEYSLADLNLASWPSSRQRPFVMSVKVSISDGYNNYESSASCNSGFTCESNYIASKANLKNVSLQNFRITAVGEFGANLDGEPEVDEILKRKRQAAGNTAQNYGASSNSGYETISSGSSNDGLSATATSGSIPANTSGNDPLANYTPHPAYSGATTEKQVYTQAAVTLVGGLLDEMNASYDRKIARLQAESDTRLRNSVARQSARFESYYYPLIDLANSGNIDAQMILYLESDNFLGDKVSLRDAWFKQALANKNVTAILTLANMASHKRSDFYPDYSYSYKEYKEGLELAATLGSVDAMVMLGQWYSQKGNKMMFFYNSNIYGTVQDQQQGGGDQEKALKYLTAAADKGSPNAMFSLGLIYKYGRIANDNYFIKFDIKKDEKLAFEWFTKSVIPDYKESLYQTHHVQQAYWEGSYFNPGSYGELAIMYREGKVVPKDLAKAAELEKLQAERIMQNQRLYGGDY